jgi:hypothetical protein
MKQSYDYPVSQHYKMFLGGRACGLYYKTSMIVIYDRNDSGQYYKTTITITIVFTILAEASLS